MGKIKSHQGIAFMSHLPSLQLGSEWAQKGTPMKQWGGVGGCTTQTSISNGIWDQNAIQALHAKCGMNECFVFK